MLSEDSVRVFLSVCHPLEYHLGYDGNRFLDKPRLLMKPLVLHKNLLISLLKTPFMQLFDLMSFTLNQIP
jgi:hypothetical protein